MSNENGNKTIENNSVIETEHNHVETGDKKIDRILQLLLENIPEEIYPDELLRNLFGKYPELVQYLSNRFFVGEEEAQEQYKNCILYGTFENHSLPELFYIFKQFNGCCGKLYIVFTELLKNRNTQVDDWISLSTIRTDNKEVLSQYPVEYIADAFLYLKEQRVIRVYPKNIDSQVDNKTIIDCHYIVQLNYWYLGDILYMTERYGTFTEFTTINENIIQSLIDSNNEHMLRTLRSPIITTEILKIDQRVELHIANFITEYLCENNTTPSLNELKEFLGCDYDSIKMYLYAIKIQKNSWLNIPIDHPYDDIPDDIKQENGIIIIFPDKLSYFYEYTTISIRTRYDASNMKPMSFAKISPENSLVMRSTEKLNSEIDKNRASIKEINTLKFQLRQLNKNESE